MRTAVLATLRRRRGGSAAPSTRGGGRPGVAFLPEVPDARMSVEIAFGADLTTDPASWPWVDVTADVRAAPGISTRLGRNDESTTTNPAELSLVLDNRSGDYSLGGRSRWYPYIRPNTPVRVRLDPGNGPRVLLLGGATGFTPGWDSLTGKIPVVTLTASGTLRRLGQGEDPVISTLTRYFTQLANAVAYWPCEVGASASNFPAVVGTSPLVWGSVAPDLSGTSIADSTAPLPTLGTSAWSAPIAPYVSVQSDGSVTVQAMMGFPTTPPASTFAQVIKVFTSGGSAGAFVFYVSNSDSGDLGVRAFAPGGSLLGDTGEQGFGVNGVEGLHGFRVYQSGGSVFASIRQQLVGSFSASSVDVALYVGTLGRITGIQINPFGENPSLVLGQVSVVADNVSLGAATVNAYDGREFVTARMTRLAAENSITLDIANGPADTSTFLDVPGPQPIDTVLNLLRACETQERGVLWDGLTAGLVYTTRRAFENASPVLTIDAGAGELSAPFAPTHDDQRRRNRWTVNRRNGAEFTVEDTTGPLGTAVIGDYGDSLTINSFADRAARDLADWLVHVGTVPGYRYPTLTIDLRAVPRLANVVVDLVPGSRVDVVNLSTALATMAPDVVSMTVEGIAWDIGPDHCAVTLSCSPYDVWRVDVLATDTGDVGDYVVHLDADDGGSTLSGNALTGATSLSVATSGPLWSTTADDYPQYLAVGGEQVRATACSGAGSPQTFTVDALVVDRHGGDVVAVWDEPSLGL